MGNKCTIHLKVKGAKIDIFWRIFLTIWFWGKQQYDFPKLHFFGILELLPQYSVSQMSL